MSEPRDRPVDLATAFLHATADEAGRERLARAVERDARALDRLGRQALVHGLLGMAAGRPVDPELVMARLGGETAVERAVMSYVERQPPAPAPRRRPRGAWLGALGWVTAAATAAWFVWLRPRPPAPPPPEVAAEARPAVDPGAPSGEPAPAAGARSWALVTLASPGVFAVAGGESRPATPGARLRVGDGLVTVAGGSRATLLLGDGSRVDVAPDSVIAHVAAPADGAAGGGRLLLVRGVLQVLRAPASPTSASELRVDSPHAAVVVASARARVQVGAEGTRLAVNAGRARLLVAGRARAVEVSAGQYALTAGGGAVTRGTRAARRAILLAGARNLHPSDAVIAARLEKLGFEVTGATAASLDLTEAADSTLLVISSSVSPQDVDARVRDLPAPILTWEVGLYPVLGMTGRCDEGDCGFHMVPPSALEIKDPSHALAAGLTGPIALPHADKVGWGTPNINAVWVAAIAGHPTRAAIFAYDRGAAMPGAAAPARRVGFFFHDSTAENLQADESVWQLFDRAVLWAVE